MVPPIDVTDITSLDAAKEAMKSGEIPVETAKLIAEAFYLHTKETQEKSNNPCPFPKHKGYATLWNKLSSKDQKSMKENIRISADGKIEMIAMKKKFSLLTPEPNGKNIVTGNHKDKDGIIADNNLTYLSSGAVKKTVKESENKFKLLKGEKNIKDFVGFMPGNSINEKISSFVQLFELPVTGVFDPREKQWKNLNDYGFVRSSTHGLFSFPTQITWSKATNKNYEFNGWISISGFDTDHFLAPYIVYEDVV